jgi:hypothetical protein
MDVQEVHQLFVSHLIDFDRVIFIDILLPFLPV